LEGCESFLSFELYNAKFSRIRTYVLEIIGTKMLMKPYIDMDPSMERRMTLGIAWEK
jgi:hypothetical protein